MSITSTSQSYFSVACNPEGAATACSQVVQTNYFVDGIQIGQNTVSSSMSLQDFQAIIAALTPAS